MKTIREIAQHPFFLLFLSISVLNISCVRSEVEEQTASVQETSGEDLFRSIFFADGPVTGQLTSLDDNRQQLERHSEAQHANFRKFQDNVISYLKDQDSNYFVNFKSAIQSKNPVIISTTIREGSEDLFAYGSMLADAEGVDLEQLVQEYNNGDFDEEELNKQGSVAIAILITVVVALVIAINVNITSTIDQDIIANTDASIERDRLVLEISTMN